MKRAAPVPSNEGWVFFKSLNRRHYFAAGKVLCECLTFGARFQPYFVLVPNDAETNCKLCQLELRWRGH